MSGRSKLLTWSLPILGVASLIGGAGLVYQNRPIVPEEVPPRPPTTAPSTDLGIDAARFIGAIGVSEPPGEAITVGSQVGGIVTSVDVEAGDRVAAGDVLFVVDSRAAASAVAQRESLLAVARADLDALRAQIPVRQAEVTTSIARVTAAEARVAQLESQLADRMNQLRIAESVDDPRAISAEEVDRRRFAVLGAEAQLADGRAGVDEARAAVVQAEAQLALLVDGDADGPDLRASAGRVEQARRELDQARVDLELRTVRAPVDADVLRVRVRPGEFAPAATVADGLIVLGRLGPTHLRVEIDETDIPRFSADAQAWASPRGDASTRLPLDVALVEPLVVPKTNLAGRTSELIDVRVLQVVYRFESEPGAGIGRLFDVYVEAAGEGE